MILVFSDQHRKDKDELKINSDRLNKSLQTKIVYMDGSINTPLKSTTELHILGHGSPDQLGGITPDELAEIIVEYMIKCYKNDDKITTIFLHSCNTGKRWPIDPKDKNSQKLSFVEKFKTSMDNILPIKFKDYPSIELYGVNGMVIFFEDGTEAVIKDTHPFEDTYNQQSIFKRLNSNNSQIKETDIEDGEERFFSCNTNLIQSFVKTKGSFNQQSNQKNTQNCKTKDNFLTVNKIKQQQEKTQKNKKTSNHVSLSLLNNNPNKKSNNNPNKKSNNNPNKKSNK